MSAVDLPLSDEPSFVSRLLDSEPRPDYSDRNRTSRQDSISYILQAHAHFRFKPVTVFLTINYLDRFLSAHKLPETGWAIQLLLVACLSLAAKMEESSVPPLLELQRFDPAYVFGTETIQRMELLVLSKLKWKLRSVTPFDYLGYFISLLSPPGNVYALASGLILNTTRAIDFLGFPPSVIAASAAITAAGGGVDFPDARINGEMVRRCCGLMGEYLVDTSEVAAASPSGVLDAGRCTSCDGSGSDGPVNKPTNVQQS